MSNELDPREIAVQERQGSIIERMNALTDTKTNQVVVRNQQEADFAGEIVRDIELLRKDWRREWYGDGSSGDIPKARSVWQGLINRFNRLDEPMETFVGYLKMAINRWSFEEQEKRRKAAEKLNRQLPADIPPLQPEAVKVSGMRAPTEVWGFEIYQCDGKKCLCKKKGTTTEQAMRYHYGRGLIELIKFVSSGGLTPQALQPNDAFLNAEVKLKHDMAVERDGGKYLYPGVKVVKTLRVDRKAG